MSSPKIMPQWLAERYVCDPETGAITRIRAVKGAFAGSQVRITAWVDKTGLLRFTYFKALGQQFQTHRVVWFLCTGEQPPALIDHINCDPSDNRMANLRAATPAQNNANARLRRGKALPKGVTSKNGRFLSHIMINRRQIYLGSFETAEQAQEAYFSRAQQHYGEYARAA